MTDRQLLTRYALGGSEEAFAQLVERHASMVYSTCLRVLGARRAAEEATQAAFLILSRKARRLAGRGALAGWLYSTSYRVARRAEEARARRASRQSVREILEEKALSETSLLAPVD